MPRQLSITAPHQLEVLNYDEKPLQSHEVRIQMEIASGKHGTTTAMFDNLNFKGQRFDQTMRLFVEEPNPPAASPKAPGATGTSGVGTVCEIGPDATRWKIGDRVVGLMGIRETNVKHEDWLWPLGDLDPRLALCIEPAYVSFHCIRESPVRYGDTVAVIGLGALGLLAVQMAVQAGAEKVIAVHVLPNRRAWAARHGAHHVVDPKSGDAALEIHRLTGGPGVDVAIELAGVYPALHTALRSARVGGTVCSAGFYQGEAKGLWLGREWHHNRLNIIVPHGCGWGHEPRDYPRWDTHRAYDAIISLMRQGKLLGADLITPIVTLDEGPEVFRLIEQEPDKVIKYAVRFTA